MNHNHTPEKREPFWHRLERGQALLEYWPTIPVAVTVMIVASAIIPFLSKAFTLTATELERVVCEVEPTGATNVDLDGGHNIRVSSAVYDPDDDRTTISFTVTSGSMPSISHWVLGIDQETASRIVEYSEPYEPWGYDPTTQKWGIKFDIGYEGGSGGGGKGGGGKGQSGVMDNGGLVLASFRAPASNIVLVSNTSGETRTIVLTLSGQIELDRVEVTTKSGNDQVSSGEISTPTVIVVSEDC